MRTSSLPFALRTSFGARPSFGRTFPLFGRSSSPFSFNVFPFRSYAASTAEIGKNIDKIRNIGISAHIDSGKTTLTERILYYTGRINQIHEVRGKDEVGAKMDSMELERQKGITIKSAATYCNWGDHHLNIIDTPGHVDFTIEVERALRVLDGAILVMCGVSGVQSQTITGLANIVLTPRTVDRQMRRYEVPRLVFINKLDRSGADPEKVLHQLRTKFNETRYAPVQVAIGLEHHHEGLIDLVRMKALYFEGTSGDTMVAKDIPEGLRENAEQSRMELLENLYEVDEELAEMAVIEEREPTVAELKAAIRRCTIKRVFSPVFMGSAVKNKGVQPLLDAVVDYLPNPSEIHNYAEDREGNQVEVFCDPKKPFLGMAFKLEESQFGQITYMRIYQGSIGRGDSIINVENKKKHKVPRLGRMHSADMEDISEVGPGEICVMFGVDCTSGTTFTDGELNLSLLSMFVPDAVISLAIWPKEKGVDKNLSGALRRFMKEDPTFKVNVDPETKQTVISGMGELHLEIYLERMRREYGVDLACGPPKVAYRETANEKAEFDYLHRKQTGGSGQYARVKGYLEPMDEFDVEEAGGKKVLFVNNVIGGTIPPNFIPACEKGFLEVVEEGSLTGHPVEGIRFVVNDGDFHAVDSSDLAFRNATIQAFRQGFAKSKPTVLEPLMNVEIQIPTEFQPTAVSSVNRRKGVVLSSTNLGDNSKLDCEVPLSSMVGYATTLRSLTQGKGEFSMEFNQYVPVPREAQERLMKQYQEEREKRHK